MATKKRVTQYQYEPPITPRHWSGDELNYAVRLSQTLDDIYNKYSALREALKEKGEGGGIVVETDPTVPAWAKKPNPPEAPVTSVNGQTGDVTVETGNALDPYPVGAIYISTSSTSPASLFGGTWEQIKDRFLLAAGSSYTAGSTGGEAEHTLINAELANHYHDLRMEYPNGTSTFGQWATYFKYFSQTAPILVEPWQADTSIAGYVYNTGGIRNTTAGQPHNNMPPYLTVYVWKRVS